MSNVLLYSKEQDFSNGTCFVNVYWTFAINTVVLLLRSHVADIQQDQGRIEEQRTLDVYQLHETQAKDPPCQLQRPSTYVRG